MRLASLTIVTTLSALAWLAAAAAEPGDVAEYTATYEVRDGGRRIARAEFRVSREADGRYVFRSSARARGILRLLRPGTAVEHSDFRIDGGGIVPLHFSYEDGSRSGDDNYTVEFDAGAGEVRISGEDGVDSVAFEEGLLDRGSLQVALMRDLAACRLPGLYRYVDEDGVRAYRYDRIEARATETGIGTLETVGFAQTREGSSRLTHLWLAPELGWLPVRIERIRGGEVDTVFTLEDVDASALEPSDCSGLR